MTFRFTLDIISFTILFSFDLVCCQFFFSFVLVAAVVVGALLLRLLLYASIRIRMILKHWSALTISNSIVTPNQIIMFNGFKCIRNDLLSGETFINRFGFSLSAS